MYYFLVFRKTVFRNLVPKLMYIYNFFSPENTKNCSKKLFSRIVLKNNQKGPKLLLFIYLVACHFIFFLNSQDHLLLSPFLFFNTFSLLDFIYLLFIFWFDLIWFYWWAFFYTFFPLRNNNHSSLLSMRDICHFNVFSSFDSSHNC